jgi:hypothetical protein
MRRLFRFFREQHGDDAITWIFSMVIVIFLFFFGALYLQQDREKSGVMFAASAGARAYGIALEDSTQNAADTADTAVLNALVAEGLLPQGSSLLSQGSVPAHGAKGAAVSLSDDGSMSYCTVTYYLPQPLPHINRLLHLPDPNFFSFSVSGASKHEYSSS